MKSNAPGAKCIRACNGLTLQDTIRDKASVFGLEAIKRMGGNPLQESHRSSAELVVDDKKLNTSQNSDPDDSIVAPVKRKKNYDNSSSDIELIIN
jgi:hypothetical protein